MFAIDYYIKLLRFRLLKKYNCTIYPSMKSGVVLIQKCGKGIFLIKCFDLGENISSAC